MKQIINYKVDELIPYDTNPRFHSDEQIEQVAKSIKEFGWTMPVLIDEHKELIAGHGRLMAAKRLGIKDVPCLVAQGWSEEQKKAYCIADNKLTENSQWDFGALKINLEFLLDQNTDLSITGFTKDELYKIIPDLNSFKGLTDEDEVPKLKNDPVSRHGDVFILGKHKLLCGDSTRESDLITLMKDAKADMVFTDPPYGIDYSGGRTQTIAKKEYGKIKNDNLSDYDTGQLLCQLFNFTKQQADVYISCSPVNQKPFIDYLSSINKKIEAVIVWDKKNAGMGYQAYRRQCEFIYFIKGKEFKKGDITDFDLWSIGRDNSTDYVHGTQKPVALVSRAIMNSSKEEDIVFDLFAGSGSALIACEKTNRILMGVELDTYFCDVIIQRWQNYTGKDAILESTGETYDSIKQQESMDVS